MKTISRIIIILLVATLVGGLFYGAVTSGSSSTGQTSLSERPTGDFPRPDGDEREDSGISFPAESIKSLAIISIVGAVYLNFVKKSDQKKPILRPIR
ncbi:MAG: hypothetical protein IPO22_20410 [Anaerolineales bacterium]|nr:hypothetical protein [Anaerolineales bacterium]